MTKDPTKEASSKEQIRRYKRHLIGRVYMSGVERDAARVKANAEIFTPKKLVRKLAKKVGLKDIQNPKKRIIDTSCGDGQFLAYILYRRLKAGVPLQDALRTIYGIEKVEDNVNMCKERLLCGHGGNKRVRDIVDRNIVCADALTYHRRFDGTPPSDEDLEGPGKLLVIMNDEE